MIPDSSADIHSAVDWLERVAVIEIGDEPSDAYQSADRLEFRVPVRIVFARQAQDGPFPFGMQQNETSTPDNLVIGVGYDNGGIHGVSPST
jgi:hypothetical protein